MARSCSQNRREGKSGFKILTGNRPLEKPRRKWDDNIKMCIKGIVINTKHWVDSAQDSDYWRALVNTALKLRGP
jgi:hypothetical protein